MTCLNEKQLDMIHKLVHDELKAKPQLLDISLYKENNMSDEIEKIVLNEEEFIRLMEILENPPEPTPLMKELIKLSLEGKSTVSEKKPKGE